MANSEVGQQGQQGQQGSPYLHLAKTPEQQSLLECIQWAIERFSAGAFAAVANKESRESLRRYTASLKYAVDDEAEAVSLLQQGITTPAMQRKLETLVSRYSSINSARGAPDLNLGFNEKPLINMIRDGDAPPLRGTAPIETTGRVVPADSKASKGIGSLPPDCKMAPPVINLGNPISDGRNPGEFAIVYAKESSPLATTYSIWGLYAGGSTSNPGSYISPDLVNEDLVILADIACDSRSTRKRYLGSVRQMIAFRVRDFLELDSSNSVYMPAVGHAGTVLRMASTDISVPVTKFEHVNLVIDNSRVDQRATRSYSVEMAKSFRTLSKLIQAATSLQPSAKLLQVVMSQLKGEIIL